MAYSSLAGISFESTLLAALLGGAFAAVVFIGACGWSLRSLRSGSARANAVAPTTGATARRRRDPRRAAIIGGSELELELEGTFSKQLVRVSLGGECHMRQHMAILRIVLPPTESFLFDVFSLSYSIYYPAFLMPSFCSVLTIVLSPGHTRASR